MNLVDKAPVNPLHRTLNTLDFDMRSILERNDMSDEEKVQAYNQILQRYLEYNRTNKETVSIQSKPSFDVEEDIMRTIPKSMKRKAESLLERIKSHPDTSWNERGEFLYRGRILPGSNVVDLVNDMLRQRKGFEPRGRFDFARALRETNIPQDLVGNRRMWGWMHRESATSDPFSTAEEDFSIHEDGELQRSRSVMKTPAKKRERKVKSRVNWESHI